MTASVSVLVPAHDEERVVGRCLRALLDGVAPGTAEVLVVANGCSDGTAQVARAAGADVLELGVASKTAALQAGDAALTALPRVYLDADVVLGPGALAALVAALPPDLPRVAAPRAEFRTQGRPALVRAFYRAFVELPYVREGLVGSGVYALSAAGRARFASFPEVTADDLFVQRMFSAEETVVLQDVTFTVETPRTLTGLLAVRTRVARGNAELAAQDDARFAPTGAGTGAALLGLVRRDARLAVPALVYAVVTLVARRRARRATTSWDRDESTR